MTTNIDIFGLAINEPVTSVTDWAVTGFAWWLGSRLFRGVGRHRQQSVCWGTGLWLIGLGALLGGTSHAFAIYLDDSAYFWIWKLTIYCIALSVTFALAGSISAMSLAHSLRRVMHGMNVLVFLAYATWMLSHSAFRFVVWHYVPVMLTIALLHAIAWTRNHDSDDLWLVGGVFVTLAGAVIQQSGFTIHRWFNHNDLYHVVQLAGLWLFYRGLTGHGARSKAIA